MRAALAAAFAVALASASAARAQSTDAFAGLGTNTKDPIQIEADKLTILDNEKKAVFSGNVNVVQGELTMRAQNLVVFYAADAAKTAAGSGKNPAAGAQQITKIEANGGITVRQKDQTATGDKAVYSAAEQTVRLTGNVVLSQGQNVVRGCALIVNLQTRSSQIESAGCGRVMFLGTPGNAKDPAKPEEAKPDKKRP